MAAWTITRFVGLAALVVASVLFDTRSASALGLNVAFADPSLLELTSKRSEGRPKVRLDHLEFPAMLGGKKYERYLRRVLKRETRKVDWGASSDSTIEYRFFVNELSVNRKGKALVVSCSARGRLPRGRSAKSQLSFGGDPAQQSRLIRRVLRIVARGVITRLAEMERVRRGKLKDSRVVTPPN